MKRIHDVGCDCRDCFSSGRDSLSALQEVIDRLNNEGCYGAQIAEDAKSETKHVHRFRGSEICIDCGANMDYISTTPIKE